MDRIIKWILECLGLWVLFVVVGLIFGDGTLGEILLGGLVLAPIVRIGAALDRKPNTGIVPREPHYNVISCKKCGYVGAGNGHCPRCGWSRTEKLTSKTTMISCRKCGYIGAGSGHCPRCGWTRVTKIQ